MSNSHKTPVGFREYIHKRRITDTRQGDFVSDAKTDPHLPDAQSWKELENYLYEHHFSSPVAMFLAAKLVWQQYRSRYPAYLFG